jgi:hypothetical protein
MTGTNTTTAIYVCRALAKGSSNAMKAAGLKLAAAVVEGLPQTDRNMAAVQTEAWKLFDKQIKVLPTAGSCNWTRQFRPRKGTVEACASVGSGRIRKDNNNS